MPVTDASTGSEQTNICRLEAWFHCQHVSHTVLGLPSGRFQSFRDRYGIWMPITAASPSAKDKKIPKQNFGHLQSWEKYADETTDQLTTYDFLLVFYSELRSSVPSVLWHCWLDVRNSTQPVKTEWWGVGVVICLEPGADCLHMVQLMPLHPKTPSSLASFKSRLALPFWYRLTQVVLEKRPLNVCSSASELRPAWNHSWVTSC